MELLDSPKILQERCICLVGSLQPSRMPQRNTVISWRWGALKEESSSHISEYGNTAPTAPCVDTAGMLWK